MRASLNRLFILALIGFFPLAIMGKLREKTSPRQAIRFYYISVLILVIFLCWLTFYTYAKGGNFVKPTGTFY